ncbi:M48 family metallopeptidase [Thalassotalea psychrophila]|uniref:M48 family metallopeptidase n=1 Tax=Thalassotalea psychrophila TaxID=3065647 RepID=A0ABY9TRA5_9GAMM|nr:M48 family metallopeptidase [Colwelliaceae bacterium SQ149]
MDFFQAQQSARKSTSRLVLLFSLAVFSLIIMTNLLVMLLFGFLATEEGIPLSFELIKIQFDWQVFFFIGVTVCAVIFAGSAYKSMSLGNGGKTIAQALGGRLVTHNTRDLNEKKLLNVVEEMAIASGTPVPAVFLLEHELGINAFAAGFKNSDAVIGVTRGCIDNLAREELQGVVAHEFSHILNGDMRLNMRLIGVLHGILLMGYIGYYILRSVRGSRKNTLPIIGLGAGLVVIGFGGNFFGNMIKASVSRQREFLADASAVQFTRSKDGIASALNKISSVGSVLDSPQAPQMSHAYFSTGVSSFVESMFATHPPIEQRIKRISPYFLINQKVKKQADKERQQKNKQGSSFVTSAKTKDVMSGVVGSVVIAEHMLNSVGSVNDKQISHATALISEIPETVHNAVHDVDQARAFIYCLLLSNEKDVLHKQLIRIKESGDKDIIDHVLRLREQVGQLHTRYRLPLIDMAIPTLKQLSQGRYELFKENFSYLVLADEHIDLFEWALQKILFRHLDSQYSKHNNKRNVYASLKNKKLEINILLSMLLNRYIKNDIDTAKIITLIEEEVGILKIKLFNQESIEIAKLNKTLDSLIELEPKHKQQLLRACLLIITQDKLFSIKEMELLRAISALLDCPMPPHLQG